MYRLIQCAILELNQSDVCRVKRKNEAKSPQKKACMRDTNRIDPESFAVQTPFSLSFALSWLDFLCFPSAQPTLPPPTRCSLLTFNTTSPRRGKTQGMLVDVENAVGGYRGSRSQYATQHHSHRPASSLMPVWQELTNDEYGWPAGAASDRPAVFCLFFLCFFFGKTRDRPQKFQAPFCLLHIQPTSDRGC